MATPSAVDTTSIKGFTSSNLEDVPSKLNFTNDPCALTSDSLPVIDFSTLTAGDPHQRSKAIHELARICQEWGFFILVNHGIPERLMDATVASFKEFFSLPENERKKYEPKSNSDPIKLGYFTMTDTSNESITCGEWLKLYLHPQFNCPEKPHLLREAVYEYAERGRNVVRVLTEAVVDAFELDRKYVEEALKMESSFQLLASSYHPPAPRPDQAFGVPPHNDHGIFTLLIHNGVAGTQLQRDGRWFNAYSPQYSLLVNVADQLQIFTNGRCKSRTHRVAANMERDRISVVVAHGPCSDAIVGPAAPLVEKDGRCLYKSTKYEDYIETVLLNEGVCILDQQMIMTSED